MSDITQPSSDLSTLEKTVGKVEQLDSVMRLARIIQLLTERVRTVEDVLAGLDEQVKRLCVAVENHQRIFEKLTEKKPAPGKKQEIN